MPEKIRFDTAIRFAYIETRLYWEDGFTATELAENFNVSRQTAQAVIEQYRQQYPQHMYYDNKRKRHVATEDFKPHYIDPRTIQFLEYLRSQNLREHYLDEDQQWSELNVADADRLLRPELPREIVQPIFAALRHRKTLLLEYQAVMAEHIRFRVVSPNHLVFVDNRYHLHAYCHHTQSYRDFVLSRILSVAASDQEWVSSAGDEEWQFVTLRYKPNPELPLEVQETLLRGYPGSERGLLEIRCRKNFVFYIERQMKMKKSEVWNMPTWIKVEEIKE
ncbi:MAG: WYL domain-containing protein [Pseudomonadota bacterium]|nr:WYL domain-containing protein [Pseudomonadota bacterium]